MGGEGGIAGAAGAGVGLGLGSTIGIGIGARVGDEVVVGGRVGGSGVGDTIAGFIEGDGAGFTEGSGAGFIEGSGAAGVDGVVGIAGGFAGAGAGYGMNFSLSLESRAFGVIIGCCGRGDGIAGETGGEALFVGFPAIGVGASGAGVDPVPVLGGVGTIGDGVTRFGLACESDGFFGGSMAAVGTIIGDTRGFADGCFFVSGNVGGVVFVSFFGVAGVALCLFPADPPAYFPHSPALSTSGNAGFGST